jgi:hypothetical protein
MTGICSTPELDQYLDYLDQCYEEEMNEDYLQDEATIFQACKEEKIDPKEYLEWEVQMAVKDQFKVETKQWEAALSELNSTGGKYLFPEVGRTKVRLLLSPEREPISFYQSVITVYHEKARTRYMMPVLVPDETDHYNYEIKLLVAPKTVLQGILTILAAGDYDFLHPEIGHGITITRAGEGLKTKYTVMPSKDPVPVDYSSLEWEQDLATLAQEFEALSAGEKEEEVEEIPW